MIVSVCGWEQFQHYKDRDPPWIKLYRDVLTTEAWVMGTDTSRLVQLASTLLAARYRNSIPANWALWKRVASLDCSEKAIGVAIDHLVKHEFLEVQENQALPKQNETVAQSASTPLATCNTETEQRQSREEQSREDPDMSTSSTAVGDATERVFEHWRQEHRHPKSVLDAKRRRLIGAALKVRSEADLCQAISGYRHSPHHMGQNDTGTVYDDIELFLRDSKHIEAGLRLYADPPRSDLSAQTRKNIAATADWVPPEMRAHAAN